MSKDSFTVTVVENVGQSINSENYLTYYLNDKIISSEAASVFESLAEHCAYENGTDFGGVKTTQYRFLLQGRKEGK